MRPLINKRNNLKMNGIRKRGSEILVVVLNVMQVLEMS